MSLIMIFFFSDMQLYHLQLCGRGMIDLYVWGVLAFHLNLCETYTTGYFFPSLSVCVCGWWRCGLIEICDSSTGYGGPLDECPWAPGLLSSLLGGWLSLGSVSAAGPCLDPLLMTLSV